MKYNRHIIAIRGDNQAGHSGGLLNPETQYPVFSVNEKGNRVITAYEDAHLRPIQTMLWDLHQSAYNSIIKLAEKDPITFVEMGDLTQGNIFKDDLDINSLSEQTIAAYYNTKPWAKIAHEMYFVRGTGVHLWGEGSTETILTMLLRRDFPKLSINIASHYLLDVGGFLIDVAHHGPGPGKRAWLRGNEFSIYLRSILMDDIALNPDKMPNIVLRAHKHEFTRGIGFYQGGGKYYELPGIITPPFCFIGDHAQKTENSPSRMNMGMIAIEVINGQFHKLHPFVCSLDLRTLEFIQ